MSSRSERTRALPLPITALMRQARATTGAVPGRAQSPGVLLSPAGAAGVRPVYRHSSAVLGPCACEPSTPSELHGQLDRGSSSLEAGGAFGVTAICTNHSTVCSTETRGFLAWA